MFNHSKEGDPCFICPAIAGEVPDHNFLRATDLVYKDRLTSVFVNSFWIPGNEGHVIVVPNTHFENLYDLDQDTAHAIIDTVQRMAIALRIAYSCDGITRGQNNEPAGGQHAFHYHEHIYPRYEGDTFFQNPKTRPTTPEERQSYVDLLKTQLS